MVKIKEIATAFFGGNTETLLNELAHSGFKVEGWKENTDLPLGRDDFRAKFFLALKKSGVTEQQFSIALVGWGLQTPQNAQNTQQPLNSVGGGAIENIEATIVDAISVQNAGIQQLNEAQLEQELVQYKASGVTEGIVAQLARMQGKFETELKIRDVLFEVNKSLHENQKNKALSLATNLVQKIQDSYSATVATNRELKAEQQNSENIVSAILSKIGGIYSGVDPNSTEGK